MHISCEKCSTTYVLDDALIPPQGTPVQCTRCQHVFTARPPPPPEPARPQAGTSTMMFGTPASQAAPKNSTMMFGTPASTAAPAPPPPAASHGQAAAKHTMMFGTPASSAAAVPPPPAASPGQPAAKHTMMFGTPASNAAPAPPPPAAGQGQAAAKHTMMFGTPASNAVASQPAQGNPPGSSKATIVFGAPAQPQAPAAPAPPPASAKHTMMFGTPASNAASQAAAAAPPPSSPAKQTMVFGQAPVSSAPPAAPAKNQTMMFGTPASNAAGHAQTQRFGAVAEEGAEETVMDQPGQSARTMMFGLPQPGAEPQAPAEPPPSAAPAKNQTMMFGRAAIPKVTAGTVELAGYAADENQPNESTVRVDLPMGGRDEVTSPRAEVEQRHDRTQRFAMSDVGGGPTPPEGSGSVPDRHNRTQLFAMSTGQDRTDTSGPALGEPTMLAGPSVIPEGDVTIGPGPFDAPLPAADLATTLPPDAPVMAPPPRARFDPPGVSVLHDPANMTPPEAAQAEPGPVATTLPNLAPLGPMGGPHSAPTTPMQPLRLELPPEPRGSPQDLLAAQQRVQAAPDTSSSTQQLPQAGGGGAGKVIIIILALIAIALAGVLAWRLFGRQLLGEAMPVDALLSTEKALAVLRLDDADNQERAVGELTALTAKYPELVEPHAALVLAEALRLDDAKALLTPKEEAAKVWKLKAGQGGEASAAAQVKLTQLEAELPALREAVKARQAALDAELARLNALLPKVEPRSPAEFAALRADAMARGVMGDAEALAIAERLRQSGQGPDNWGDLIEPEYALNGGTRHDEALEALAKVAGRESNSTFLRVYVLAARLHLLKGEPQKAVEHLESVVTANGRHAMAATLLASAKAARE